MFDIMNAQEGQMNNLIRFSEIMAASTVSVPKHLIGQVGDCLAICLQAHKWGMDAFQVSQQSFLVNGTLGYSAQLVNAVISSSKAIKGRFHYEYDWKQGDKNGLVRCGAVLNGEDEIQWGEWLDTNIVTTKNSPLWKTNPKQQSAYLAVKQWSRLYTPDVILGVYTKDELEDNPPRPPRDITPEEPVVELIIPEVEEVTIESAIAQMNECSTIECLNGCTAKFSTLNQTDKETARKHYAERKRDIKAKELAVDTVTGEVTE